MFVPGTPNTVGLLSIRFDRVRPHQIATFSSGIIRRKTYFALQHISRGNRAVEDVIKII